MKVLECEPFSRRWNVSCQYAPSTEPRMRYSSRRMRTEFWSLLIRCKVPNRHDRIIIMSSAKCSHRIQQSDQPNHSFLSTPALTTQSQPHKGDTFNMDMENSVCFKASGSDSFPCNTDAITVVSVGLGTGAISLVFVLYLMRKVRYDTIRYSFGSVWRPMLRSLSHRLRME